MDSSVRSRTVSGASRSITVSAHRPVCYYQHSQAGLLLSALTGRSVAVSTHRPVCYCQQSRGDNSSDVTARSHSAKLVRLGGQSRENNRFRIECQGALTDTTGLGLSVKAH